MEGKFEKMLWHYGMEDIYEFRVMHGEIGWNNYRNIEEEPPFIVEKALKNLRLARAFHLAGKEGLDYLTQSMWLGYDKNKNCFDGTTGNSMLREYALMVLAEIAFISSDITRGYIRRLLEEQKKIEPEGSFSTGKREEFIEYAISLTYPIDIFDCNTGSRRKG